MSSFTEDKYGTERRREWKKQEPFKTPSLLSVVEWFIDPISREENLQQLLDSTGLQDIPVLGIFKFRLLSEWIQTEPWIERSLLINLADYTTESTRRLRAILEFLVDIQRWANSRGKRYRNRGQGICKLCYRWIPEELGRFCHTHNPLPLTGRKKSGAEYVRARRMISRAKEYCDHEDWFPNFHFMAKMLGEVWEIPSLCPVGEWNRASKIVLMEACGTHFRKAFPIIKPSFLQLEQVDGNCSSMISFSGSISKIRTENLGSIKRGQMQEETQFGGFWENTKYGYAPKSVFPEKEFRSEGKFFWMNSKSAFKNLPNLPRGKLPEDLGWANLPFTRQLKSRKGRSATSMFPEMVLLDKERLKYPTFRNETHQNSSRWPEWLRWGLKKDFLAGMKKQKRARESNVMIF